MCVCMYVYVCVWMNAKDQINRDSDDPLSLPTLLLN